MSERDEDIDIIDPPEGNPISDSPPTFIIKSGTDENPQASHHALYQAYEDMKRRHQQLKGQNDILQQTIREMEYSRQLGGRNNSNMFGAAGPSGASPGAEQDEQTAHVKAQIGYAESVQRQLMRAQAKILAFENENKELKIKLQNLTVAKNNTGSANTDSSLLVQKNNELNQRNSILTDKVQSLTSDIERLKQLLKEKETQIQIYDKQKIPELQTEMKEKDVHISHLMEHLKTVSHVNKGYEQKILTMDHHCPESGYNTRMNDDQNLLSVEESKQILMEIDKHKKTLQHFLSQLQIQTETIQKQGQIIQHLKKRAVSSNKRIPGEGSDSVMSRDPAASWPTVNFVKTSPIRGNNYNQYSGARPKDASYNLNSRLFPTSVVPKSNSSPILSPYEDNGVTISQGDTLFGQGGRGGVTECSSSYDNYTRLSVDNVSRNYMPSEVGSKFSPSILVSQQGTENSEVIILSPTKDIGIKETKAVTESSQGTDIITGRQKKTAQVCPVCNREFPAMSMEDFQQHVFECIDDGDDDPPQTLQNPTVDVSSAVDRICPMCNKAFVNTLPLAEFEKHVQDHFNEESIVDRFEVLHP